MHIGEADTLDTQSQNRWAQNRWAIVLAGGEGKRLRSLTRQLGYDVPKQFCPLLEQETLLQLTLRRVALAIDPAQTLTVVTRSHERFFSPLMAELAHHDPHHNPQRNLIVQSDNRGTAAAIAYGAFRLAEMDPAASVAVFPSDHWFSDDAELMRNVERAFALVSEFQDLTVALGVAAERPEAGYGWFELGAPIVNQEARLFEVRRFWEKPPAETTRAIWSAGAHRNSFILVAKVSALLSLILKTLPRLHGAFHSVRAVMGTMFERTDYRVALSRSSADGIFSARDGPFAAGVGRAGGEQPRMERPWRAAPRAEPAQADRADRAARATRQRDPNSLPANARRRLN